MIMHISPPPSPEIMDYEKHYFPPEDNTYEVIHEPNLEENCNTYDTLDFHRPMTKLEGHYQSSKTLKTLSSQDYLCPMDKTVQDH